MRSKASVREEYISLIGYDPFADDPSATVADVARRLEDYKHVVSAYGNDDADTGNYSGWHAMQAAARDAW